jgi:60 kDa SS-A/Ro ribonucleoprotein
MLYTKHFAPLQTPQSLPLTGASQAPNSAGGYVWAVSDWTRLDRFLVLGSEGGAYYIGERAADAAERRGGGALPPGGRPAHSAAHRGDQHWRARAQERSALFGLALCSSLGDVETRRAALLALPHVARTGTHLFHFLAAVESCRGWGRALRRAVASWYTGHAGRAARLPGGQVPAARRLEPPRRAAPGASAGG